MDHNVIDQEWRASAELGVERGKEESVEVGPQRLLLQTDHWPVAIMKVNKSGIKFRNFRLDQLIK